MAKARAPANGRRSPARLAALIEEREARLRSILESAPDAIVTIDERGIIQSFSQAAQRLFGYAAGEVIGRNVSVLMPEPWRGEHDAYIARYLATGERHIIGIGREVTALSKDGAVFPIELAVGEARAGGTRIFTGFVRDLRARRRMEEELLQAQKMEAVGQLAGGMAHDFNNLLTVISGNLEMLEPHLREAESRELLGEAAEAARAAAELSGRLLAFSRKEPLDPRPVGLNRLLQGLADLLRRTLGGTIEVELRLAEGPLMAITDPGQAENAILNLAINSRDAMPEGGRLTVETGREVAVPERGEAPRRLVTLRVSDTGLGMSEEVRRRAFEPFFTTKGPGKGTGLGLSMVYGFVRQSGGEVEIESAPGQGTSVLIRLPEAAAAAEASVPGAATGPSGRQRVLVVEDDARVRRVSARRIAALGHAVIEAASGPEALSVIEGGAGIDLLFTDIVMAGGMSGIALAEAARRHRPGLKILFTSGHAEPEEVVEARGASGAGWLAKPYGIAALEAAIEALMARP